MCSWWRGEPESGPPGLQEYVLTGTIPEITDEGNRMSKTALITGITGQDGSYLAEFLLSMGYRVCGLVRRSSTVNFERLDHLQDKIELIPGDLLDQNSLISALQQSEPRGGL